MGDYQKLRTVILMVSREEYEHVKRNYKAVLRELKTLDLPQESLVKNFCETMLISN